MEVEWLPEILRTSTIFVLWVVRITKLDKEKNVLGEKTGARSIVKEIKQYQKKVATTRTEDGHK